ncbi:hypothetical protein GCM10020000_17970 [Streptomyces olivoverticillatus]
MPCGTHVPFAAGGAQEVPDPSRRERVPERHALAGPGQPGCELEVACHQQHHPGPRQGECRPPLQGRDVAAIVLRRAQGGAYCCRVREGETDGTTQAHEIAGFGQNPPEGRGGIGHGRGEVRRTHEGKANLNGLGFVYAHCYGVVTQACDTDRLNVCTGAREYEVVEEVCVRCDGSGLRVRRDRARRRAHER